MWIDPDDTKHWLLGSDGGMYETWDDAKSWQFKRNLPTVQFYDVAVDNALPVLQRVRRDAGLFLLVRPVAHAQRQWDREFRLVCHDRRRRLPLAGRPGRFKHCLFRVAVRGAGSLRQADGTGTGAAAPRRQRRASTALELGLAHHHQPAFAHASLFRGKQAVSQRRPRRYLEGNLGRSDAADRSQQASGNGQSVERGCGGEERLDFVLRQYRGAVGVTQKKEGLLYVGTDDGLFQVTSDGGGTWTKYEKFPGVPDMTYVSRLAASNRTTSTRSTLRSRITRMKTSNPIC